MPGNTSGGRSRAAIEGVHRGIVVIPPKPVNPPLGGQPALDVDALLTDTPKNVFTTNGHDFNPAGFLNVHSPGNGAPPGNAPGFPPTAHGR